MTSTLLINHIEVGKIEVDDTSGCLTPYLQTFIKGDGYTVLMENYKFNFDSKSIQAKYLLTEYNDDGSNKQTPFIFNSKDMECDENECPFEFYQFYLSINRRRDINEY